MLHIIYIFDSIDYQSREMYGRDFKAYLPLDETRLSWKRKQSHFIRLPYFEDSIILKHIVQSKKKKIACSCLKYRA